jgi:hypothetical protein
MPTIDFISWLHFNFLIGWPGTKRTDQSTQTYPAAHDNISLAPPSTMPNLLPTRRSDRTDSSGSTFWFRFYTTNSPTNNPKTTESFILNYNVVVFLYTVKTWWISILFYFKFLKKIFQLKRFLKKRFQLISMTNSK